jgi:hypothetical protein
MSALAFAARLGKPLWWQAPRCEHSTNSVEAAGGTGPVNQLLTKSPDAPLLGLRLPFRCNSERKQEVSSCCIHVVVRTSQREAAAPCRCWCRS